MLYNRSLEIERRLDDVLRLVREGQQSTPTLAKALNISESQRFRVACEHSGTAEMRFVR
jgi:hypothetical protein